MEDFEEFSEKEESTFDLKAEIYKYLTYWKWLLLGSLLGLLIAFLYNRYTIPAYETVASMMILNEDKSVASALPSGGASILAVDESNLQNQIENLRSKRLISGVVDELDLNISYYNEGKVITVEAYENSSVVVNFVTPDSIVHDISKSFYVTPQSSDSYRLTDANSVDIGVFNFGEVISHGSVKFIIKLRGEVLENNNTVNIRINPLRQVVSNYIQKLEVEPKGRAKDILSLSITGEVPEKSQDFLNTLMTNFNIDGMTDKRQVAESTANFIQNRLTLISEELDSVEGGIADFKRENQIMDVGTRAGQSLSRSTMAEEEIFNLETQLMIIRSLSETLNSTRPYRLLPADLGIEGGGVSGLINQYNNLVLERNALLESGTPQNPTVIVLTERLDSLKENLLDNIKSSIDSYEIRLRELNQLDQRAAGEFSTFPGLEKGIRSIERQQQIKEQLYLFLLQRREESAISYAATSPVAKVIDPAFTQGEPVDPKPWLILLGGFFIGFLIPLLIVFVRNFLDTKVHHKGDLFKITKEIPFLGEIPRVSGDALETIQVNDRSPLAESFRILRTNLAYLVQSRNKDKAEVIFVTSTIKGEGKTFISYNLSRTLASTGKKVLLIGADIRNPKLHRFSKASLQNKGLSDFLYNHDLESLDVITSSNEEGIPVDFIFSGAIPPNPAELFMNDRMEFLLNEERENYDYIIVDTAPTMIVTDTLLISPLADTTLYVTRAGYTEKKLLDFPKDLKKQGKLKGVAIVLNDVDYSKFSYGAKYGYAYGYGYGYGADEEKKSIFSRVLGKFKS
ncbi:GumC family protein [Salinimicrobium sp. GXAS 041]|uniref:GumC family protein n=1 Tax=Salinimicrobium sp. GXAS 041 TaxID=3400806 RepID=UPI003C71238C